MSRIGLIFFTLASFTILGAFGQTISSVTNSASFAASEVAPGSIATIFGADLSTGTALAEAVPLPTTLAGTTVKVNGTPVPLYFVSPNQINFQVPNDALAGLPTFNASLTIGSSSAQFTVSTAAPGIFIGTDGHAVVQNQDYSINAAADPAATASYVTVYLTGIGPVDNPVAAGVATPSSSLSRATSPVSATIGRVPASVVFLGLTPQNVGLAQANIQIPDLPPGTYPLVITVGGAVSNPGSISVSGGSANPLHLLTTLAGVGANGIPSTGSTSWTAGSAVPYNFSPAAGFSAAVVEVDGTLQPPNGNLSMNADHWLWAFGQPSAGTRLSSYITAPNDPVIIPYPQFYANRPNSEAVTVADPYCAPTSKVIAYPNNYLGRFPMPAVTGAPLPISVQRGVAILDIWGCCQTNPALNTGCSGNMHTAFQETVARVKRLGASHIIVTTYPFLVDATAATPVFDVKNQQTTDSELAFIADTARAAGLDVWLYINIPGTDENNVSLPAKPTQTWFAAFMDAYTQFAAREAQVAQQNGVKAILFGWRDYYLDVTSYLDAYVPRMTAALSQVRSGFAGKVVFYDTQLSNAVYSNPKALAPLYNGVDALLMISSDGLGLTSDENRQLSVPLMKQHYKQALAQTAQKLALLGRQLPLVVEGYVFSGQDSLVNPVGDELWGCSTCAAMQADFSVQVIAYEALFEATVESGLNILSFETYGYWPTDIILPKETYPNVGRTVRNKPAEAVIQRWFAR